MALKATELEQLKKALTDGLKEGFADLKNNSTGAFGGNPGNGTNVNKFDEEYIEKKVKEIEAQEKAIKEGEGKYGNTSFGKDKLRELGYQKERLRNGGISSKDVKAAKTLKTKNIIGAIANIGNAVVDIFVAMSERNIAITRARLDYGVAVFSSNLEKQNKIFSTGMKGVTSGFTKNAHEMAYDATQASYDLATTSMKNAMEMKVAGKAYTADVKKANADAVTAYIGAGAAIGAAVLSIIPGIGTGVGLIVGTVVGAVAGLVGKAYAKYKQQNIKRIILEKDIAEKTEKVMESMMNSFKTIAEPWDELYKNSSDFVLKFNDASTKFGATIGYFGKTGDDFSKAMLDMNTQTLSNGSNLALMFGKEADKLPQIMEAYIASSSRAVNLGAEDFAKVMGTGRLFGMSSEKASGLYGTMNIFNTSVTSASDSMGVMYHQITKMGLSSKKFGENLVENLKLAQKYNFKGGVENMMKLTKWSQQTRFNLNNAASFADSILNDSLSGALEKSAKLQVLGGNAAMFSDPFGMLFDAGSDVGNMAERMHKMFGDISGTFNSKTGQTDFSWFENRMIQARAQALGMDPGEVKDMIRQNNKQGVIDRILGNKLSEEDRLAIGNRATYNQKSGKWEVTDIKGVSHDINEYVNGNADIDELLPADTQEGILAVSEKSLTHLEKLDNYMEHLMRKLGGENQTAIFETEQHKLDNEKKLYEENWDKTVNLWNEARLYSEQTFELQNEIMKLSLNDDTILKDIHKTILTQNKTILKPENFGITKKAAEFGSYGALEAFSRAQVTNMDNDKTKDMFAVLRDKTLIDYAANVRKNPNYPINHPITDYLRAASKGAQSLYNYARVIPQAVEEKNSKDGIGYTNGGIITGASRVKSINDGSVNVRTAKNDQYLVAKSGGPIDMLLKSVLPGLQALLSNGSENRNVNINFGGEIMLNENGSNINLVEIMKNNPAMASLFVRTLQKAVETNKNGKPMHNYMV